MSGGAPSGIVLTIRTIPYPKGSYLPFSPRHLIERLLPEAQARRLLGALGRLPGLDDAGTVTARNMAASAFAARVLSAGLAYVSQMLLARWMGGFEYGVFVVLWTFVITLGVVFAFGFEQSVVTLLRKYAHDGDHGAIRGLVGAARAFAFLVATLVAAAGCALLWTRPDLVADYRLVPIFVAAICLPIYSVSEIQDGIAVAEGWPDLALGPTFLARPALILLVVGAFVVAGTRVGAVHACWAAVIATWSVTVVQGVLIGRRLARVVPAAPRRWKIAEWARTTTPLFLVDSFVVLLSGIDVLLVGRFVEPERVAVYFATVKTLALVHFVYYAAKVAGAKRFATLWHAGRRAELSAFVADVVTWTFRGSLIMACVVLVIGRPLLGLFGPGFTDGFPILFVMVVGVLARASVGPAETLLSMAGQQAASARVYGLTLAVALLANLILVPLWGIWGAAWGMTLAMVFEAFVLAIAVRRRLGLEVFYPAAQTRARPPG